MIVTEKGEGAKPLSKHPVVGWTFAWQRYGLASKPQLMSFRLNPRLDGKKLLGGWENSIYPTLNHFGTRPSESKTFPHQTPSHPIRTWRDGRPIITRWHTKGVRRMLKSPIKLGLIWPAYKPLSSTQQPGLNTLNSPILRHVDQL